MVMLESTNSMNRPRALPGRDADEGGFGDDLSVATQCR